MKPLDKFGEFVIRNLRDKAIKHHTLLQQGHWRAPALQELQAAVTALPEETKRLLLRCVEDSIDHATHGFLFGLVEAHDNELGIEVKVDGVNVVEASDGLEGEPYGDEGWIKKYSKYPQ